MFKVESHDPRPLKWWYEQFLRERLDMHPPYQRKSYIWSKWKQAHLIDTILNGFDIPKFYVANFLAMPSTSKALNRERRPYAIIDGKQRFQAIFDFLGGNLELNATFVLNEDKRIKIAGMRFPELRTKHSFLADRIQGFVPAVMNVIAEDESFIEELFVRLNSGEATTGAERRNAMRGPVPAIVRELVLHPFFQRNIRFNTQRMQDSNLAAKLLLIESKNGFVDTKARNLDDFAKGAAALEDHKRKGGGSASDVGELGKARDRVYATLEDLSGVFGERDKLLSAQGQIPVYYWVARRHKEFLPWFRAFLEKFTTDVSENLRLMRKNPDDANQELSNYYAMSRTTNDQSSLQGRFDFLVKKLREFIRKHPKPQNPVQ